jgi:hypothetical protein
MATSLPDIAASLVRESSGGRAVRQVLSALVDGVAKQSAQVLKRIG